MKNPNKTKEFFAKTKVTLKKGFLAFSKKPVLQAWIIPLFSILLSFIVASIVLSAIGAKPGLAIKSMFQGSGLLQKAKYGGGQSQLTDFMVLVNNVTPMIFAALAVAVALKAGLFNIGVSGQMVLSGFVATMLVGYGSMPTGISRFLVILIGMAVGGATGALMGWLKYKFNINEVVQSIMFNYIYLYVVTFFIFNKYLNTTTRSSIAINENARLSIMSMPLGKVNVVFSFGFILAIIAAFAVWFLLNKTKTGYEIKAVGLNRKAANYGGISVGKTLVLAMTVSGVLAGLAGVSYYLGSTNTILPNTLTSMGFDAISVTLLGNSHPLGMIFSAFLISGMTSGSTYMQAKANVSVQIPSLIVGILLLFSACGAFLKHYIKKFAERIEEADRLAAQSEAAIEPVIPPETTQTLQSGDNENEEVNE
jgi:ABC-type uncharacterized transport system, permease component